MLLSCRGMCSVGSRLTATDGTHFQTEIALHKTGTDPLTVVVSNLRAYTISGVFPPFSCKAKPKFTEEQCRDLGGDRRTCRTGHPLSPDYERRPSGTCVPVRRTGWDWETNVRTPIGSMLALPGSP